MQQELIETLQQAFGLQQSGDLQQAESLYLQVLEADRKNIHALNLMGMLCVNSGRPEEAVKYLSKALKITPDGPQTHANMGLAFKDQGMFRKAAHHLQRSLKINPTQAVVHNNLGNVYRELEQHSEAVVCFRRSLELEPDAAECWSNLAAALNESEQQQMALQAAERALQLAPTLAQAWNNKGDVLLKQALYSEAFDCYRKAADIDPRYYAALINMARAQRDLDQPENALETLESVLVMEPRHPEAHFIKGVLLEQMGQQKDAADSFHAAIETSPRNANAHYQLAQLKGRDISDDETKAMEALWQDKELGRSARMYLAFGLYRAYDQRGQYDEAYRFLARGNRLKSEISPYDDTGAAGYFESLVGGSEVLIAAAGRHAGVSDDRPVFVLGMPRSGTSLTEQILASHTRVAGAGERSYAFDTAHEAKQLTGLAFPGSLDQLTSAQVKELGEYYLSRHSESDLLHARVVDKTPLNFQYIGLLALALPGARFIHCHRDPVQNCFSIHQLPFDKKQTYAHDLVALGSYYRRYRQLMRDWHLLFPGRILDVSYEETVADVEAQSRRMLEFIDLPFEPGVLEFFRTKRLVKTPSASQVREPIYKDSLQKWRRYETHLQPLIEALGDLAPAPDA